ncbi:MAG: hypothetical protein AB1486_20135 [Planctomycetota bacterium]
MGYRLIRHIGGKGSGHFSESLNGITVGRDGLIYAVGDREVKVFRAEGELEREFPTEQPGYCVALDAEGMIFVGEAGLVELFNRSGSRQATWRDAPRLGSVTSIGFFQESVLLADATNRCIRRYDRAGKWLSDIGKNNNTKGFLIPNGYLDFAVDAAGTIHAANPGKFRVERYSLSGELLGHFGRYGTRLPEEFPPCCNPTNLTLTENGRTIVTEKAGPRVKVFDATGTMVALISGEPFDANCKNMDVATDAAGRIYVADTVRLSILVFAPAEDESQQLTPPRAPDARPGEDGGGNKR